MTSAVVSRRLIRAFQRAESEVVVAGVVRMEKSSVRSGTLVAGRRLGVSVQQARSILQRQRGFGYNPAGSCLVVACCYFACRQ